MMGKNTDNTQFIYICKFILQRQFVMGDNDAVPEEQFSRHGKTARRRSAYATANEWTSVLHLANSWSKFPGNIGHAHKASKSRRQLRRNTKSLISLNTPATCMWLANSLGGRQRVCRLLGQTCSITLQGCLGTHLRDGRLGSNQHPCPRGNRATMNHIL